MFLEFQIKNLHKNEIIFKLEIWFKTVLKDYIWAVPKVVPY